jgi:hypothetical protein
MRLVSGSITAATLALAASLALHAQGAQQETVPPVQNGGVFAPGWEGSLDPGQMSAPGVPSKITDARFAKEGDIFNIETGPAATYWSNANKATGDYTVKGTFNEPKFQNRMTHPHPYGVVIAGNDMGTENNTFLYCEAYGNGTFIMRGFGPKPFTLGAPRATANPAVHKAAGIGQPVTQDISMSVKGDTVSCSINGTQVATYAKADVVGPGKLKSLDGVYGIRFAHNTEGSVSGFGMAK